MSAIEARLAEIALRKERLKARADAQRRALDGNFRQLNGPAAIVDRGRNVMRFARAHPVLVAAGAMGIVAIRARFALSLAGSLLSAWRLWRAVSALAGGRSS